MPPRRLLLLGAAVAGFALSGVAHAQTTNEAAAVAAFDEAERLMAAQKYAEACSRYAESYRLDPQLGSLLHLADCYETRGQLASAWARFRDAAELAGRRGDQRLELARERVARLEPRLSRLRIDVPNETVVAGLEIKRDGVVVGEALWGSPIPVDPGTHVIRVSAPGKLPWSRSVTLSSEGHTESISIARLEDAPLASQVSPKPSPATAPPAAPAPVGEQPRGSAQRILGFGLLGAGAVGIGVGVFFMSKRADRLAERAQLCPGDTCKDADEARRVTDLTDEARSANTVGTIGLVAGGVLASGGVVLLLTAPKSSSRVALAPALNSSFRGVSLTTSLW